MYCFKLKNLKGIRLSEINWLMHEGIINKDVWLAGGSLRTTVDQNETIVDYDLFFKNKETNPFLPIELTTDRNDGEVLKTRDKLEKLGFKLTFECPEGKMYTYEYKTRDLMEGEVTLYKVQLICEHFYSSPEELLSTFDLTPCIFCTDGEFLWAEKTAIKGVKYKEVRIHRLMYPVNTMRRIIKYASKGYKTNLACRDFLDNLMLRYNIQISENDLVHYID